MTDEVPLGELAIISDSSKTRYSVYSSEPVQGFIAHPDLCDDVISALNEADLTTQRQNVRGALNYHMKRETIPRPPYCYHALAARRGNIFR
jgi:hypothetical protein